MLGWAEPQEQHLQIDSDQSAGSKAGEARAASDQGRVGKCKFKNNNKTAMKETRLCQWRPQQVLFRSEGINQKTVKTTDCLYHYVYMT